MFRVEHCTTARFFFYGILIMQTCFHFAECSVLLSPYPGLTVEKEPFTMTCTYNGSESVYGFIWLLNGNSVAVLVLQTCKPHSPPGPPDPSLYDYTCESDKQSTFTVKHISNKNKGDFWQCGASIPRYIYSNNVSIVVQVPVRNVSLTPPKESIIENTETSFTCMASESRPAATISWYKQSSNGQSVEEVANKVSASKEIVRDLERSTSVLQYIPSRGDNGYRMYCAAVNIQGRKSVTSAKFTMNVLYTPNGPPEILNYPNGSTYTVIENNQSQLICSRKGGNPLATLTWFCFNNGLSSVTNGTTVTKTVTWKATRGPDKSCTCLSSHPAALKQLVSVNVHVLYMAVVTSFTAYQNQGQNLTMSMVVNESDPVKFECVVDSQPGSTVVIQSKGRQLETQNNTKILTYSLVTASCLDTGVYTCSARNQYNLGKTSEKTLNLFVRCSPRPLTAVKENVTGALRYPVIFTFKGLAYPTPIFSWMKREASEWKVLSNSSFISIFISGVDSSMTINNVSLSDFGEYQLKIENEINNFIQPYFLTPEQVPETPSDFLVVGEHISDTFALLRWKPGFNGGSNQTFILMYKRSLDQIWMQQTVDDTGESVIIYTLHNLASNAEYTILLFARNRVGDSGSSENITFITKATKEDISDENSSAISGGIITGIVSGIVLCILLVAVSCYLFRRNKITCKGPVKETSNKPETREQGDYTEMNTSYQNASHVYDSLQVESDVTANVSNRSEYMSLDKGNNDKDVYTELDRQPNNIEQKKVYVNMENVTNEN